MKKRSFVSVQYVCLFCPPSSSFFPSQTHNELQDPFKALSLCGGKSAATTCTPPSFFHGKKGKTTVLWYGGAPLTALHMCVLYGLCTAEEMVGKGGGAKRGRESEKRPFSSAIFCKKRRRREGEGRMVGGNYARHTTVSKVQRYIYVRKMTSLPLCCGERDFQKNTAWLAGSAVFPFLYRLHYFGFYRGKVEEE